MMQRVTRHYVMRAKPDGGEALREVLQRIAYQVSAVEGCEGVEVLRDLEDGEKFLLIERWISVDAHKAAGPKLQENLLPVLIAALGGQPDAGYFQEIIAL